MKAQMEIMGLAVIVVLIALGIFIFIGLSARFGEVNQIVKPEAYNDERLATTYVDALLRTSVPSCHALHVDELLRDCALNNRTCGALGSCELVQLVIENVTNATLDVWGKNYSLNVTYPLGTKGISFSKGPPCVRRYGVEPYTVRLHPFPGDVLVELSLCKK
ncbi:MAG: hypothetical protein V1725_06235 [archaeon]